MLPPKSPYRPQHAHEIVRRRPIFEKGDKADFTETKTILRELRGLMDPEEDIAAISEAEQWLLKQEETKGEAVARLEHDLKVLNKTLLEAISRSSRPPTLPSPAEHDAQLLLLESAHVTTGKKVNAEQGEVGRREGELRVLKEEREGWVGRDVGREWAEGEGREAGGRTLKLNMIHDAGFSLNANKDTVLIRNEKNVHAFRIDDDKPKSFTTNMLWRLASE